MEVMPSVTFGSSGQSTELEFPCIQLHCDLKRFLVTPGPFQSTGFMVYDPEAATVIETVDTGA